MRDAPMSSQPVQGPRITPAAPAAPAAPAVPTEVAGAAVLAPRAVPLAVATVLAVFAVTACGTSGGRDAGSTSTTATVRPSTTRSTTAPTTTTAPTGETTAPTGETTAPTGATTAPTGATTTTTTTPTPTDTSLQNRLVTAADLGTGWRDDTSSRPPQDYAAFCPAYRSSTKPVAASTRAFVRRAGGDAGIVLAVVLRFADPASAVRYLADLPQAVKACASQFAGVTLRPVASLGDGGYRGSTDQGGAQADVVVFRVGPYVGFGSMITRMTPGQRTALIDAMVRRAGG
ncbi:MAG: hypothetical protein HYX34_13270 [Actinobacteria bacterium]|nr:hypothetical protein [Actinomycetota bacterium]